MCPFQRISGEKMIECDDTPTGIIVTGRTAFIRVILGIQDPLMDVLMAIITSFADLPEFPPFIFLVTFETWNSLV